MLSLRYISKESADDLRKLISDVTDSIESLRAIGATVFSWNYLTVPLVVRRLDSKSYLDWEDSMEIKRNSQH